MSIPNLIWTATAEFIKEKLSLCRQTFGTDSTAAPNLAAPSDANREDLLEESSAGLISVVGGKLTTARIMAIRVLGRVLQRIGQSRAWRPCKTGRLSLGGKNAEVAEGLARWVKRCPQMSSCFRILYNRYGVDAESICGEVLRIHLHQHPDLRAESSSSGGGIRMSA